VESAHQETSKLAEPRSFIGQTVSHYRIIDGIGRWDLQDSGGHPNLFLASRGLTCCFPKGTMTPFLLETQMAVL